MKKIAWFAAILVVVPLALTAACGDGGGEDEDGSGGTDGGTGGSDPTGGNGNDGTGGSTGGNTSGGTGGVSTGGSENPGGMGGMGGLGGMGGGEGDPLVEACETMCATAVAGDASDCDEADCVYGCAYGYAAYYAAYGCEAEYLALKECAAELEGSDFFCLAGTVGTEECPDEADAVTACLP